MVLGRRKGLKRPLPCADPEQCRQGLNGRGWLQSEGALCIKDKGCKSKELAPGLGKTGLDILHQSGETQKGKGDFSSGSTCWLSQSPGQG